MLIIGSCILCYNIIIIYVLCSSSVDCTLWLGDPYLSDHVNTKLWRSWPVSSIWSKLKPVFWRIWQFDRTYNMPTSRDLLIFVPTTTTNRHLAHARGVIIISSRLNTSLWWYWSSAITKSTCTYDDFFRIVMHVRVTTFSDNNSVLDLVYHTWYLVWCYATYLTVTSAVSFYFQGKSRQYNYYYTN